MNLGKIDMEKSKKTLKIIQLTDTHLMKDESCLFNINTNRAFKKVMSRMQPDLIDTDALFLTGDLSQDESLESYQMIVDSFENINKNIFWIPGNHDSINTMESVFCNQKKFFRKDILSTEFWKFIFLDTKHDGTDNGLLSDEQLSFLNSELKKAESRSIALVMHHHPIEVSTPLIDNYILKNKERFWDIVSQYNVALVICGHVHGDYSLNYGSSQIESSPASCFQFKKGALKLEIDNSIGYKIYYFLENTYDTETKLWKN
jgi:Icc protein